MSDSDLKFVIFRDLKDGYYRWRLRSPMGETVRLSEQAHAKKDECERDVYSLIEERYPHAKVRDAAIG